MKVLLCDDVEKLGWLGDVVEVKPGYARNYLLPQGLAKIPTEANIKALAEEKARRAAERKLARNRQEALAKAVALPRRSSPPRPTSWGTCSAR